MAVKYYSDDWPTNAAKLAFEKSVFTKTQKTNARTEGIIMNLKSKPIVSLVFVQDLRINCYFLSLLKCSVPALLDILLLDS